jgi:APA family basic amino acid/polyamine antiporter
VTGRPLDRVLGTAGATMLGLGSVLGTGLFVALALASDVAGVWSIGAVVAAGFVATCSGLSSARLAAAHPVSGGTYVHATRLLGPAAGLAAGWLFLAAKTASAATAALGVSAYGLAAAGVTDASLIRWPALAVVAAMSGLLVAGLRRAAPVNAALVACTVLSLLAAIAAMTAAALADPAAAGEHLRPLGSAPSAWPLLHAAALSFVAFTGFGRVATLGEEVRNPSRTIPRAVVVTLVISGLLCMGILGSGLAAVGPQGFAGGLRDGEAGVERVAVLARIVGEVAEDGRLDATVAGGVRWLLLAGAGSAMLGVLLGLILGLSRVILAMGRDGCLPPVTARVGGGGQPVAAILLAAAAVAGLVLLGDVRVTWTFSAVTVLGYYGLTNLAATRLPPPESGRRRTRVAAWAGLAGCVSLAVAVPGPVWAAAAAVLALGFGGRMLGRRRWRP